MQDVGAAAHEALRARSKAAREAPGHAVVLLALDPVERRRAVEAVLTEAGFEVLHAHPGGDALEAPAAPGPEALVIIGGLPRSAETTPAAVAALRRAGWDHVVVVDGDTRASAVASALGTGARGFLVAGPALRPAEGVTVEPAPQALAVSDVAGRERSLSAREVQVLALAAEGLSNPEIAHELGLSALTVKSHLSRMTRRLGAHDRAHLVLLGMRAGVIV